MLYIHVLHDEFLLPSTLMTTDLKKNSWGRTRLIKIYTPPINAPITALVILLFCTEFKSKLFL